MREPGFYWVTHRSLGEQIAEFDGKWWHLTGDTGFWEDKHFSEIDEQEIVRDKKTREETLIAARDENIKMLNYINARLAELDK